MNPLSKSFFESVDPKMELRLDQFMQASNAFYYAHKDPFGEKGDFYTSPELCQIFGELLGLWSYSFWAQHIQEPLQLVELGPGRGTLLQDFWRATEKYWPQKTISFSLLESSSHLKEIQKKNLLPFLDRINWHDTIEDLSFSGPFILIANEFLDALPIRQFRQNEGIIEELYVKFEKDQWIPFFKESTQSIQLPDPEKISEISEEVEKCVHHICQKLLQYKGVAIFIDYGYTKNGGGDSLQAIYKHNFVSPFEFPGQADLSAHVNFEIIKQIGEEYGLRISGPLPQAQFLNELGFQQRADKLVQKAPNPHAFLRSARALVDPLAMGSLFKVIALSSFDHNIVGF
jgi:NADH dehydrogenase [ubiquinone] 1 alpha subcomplex assembly factor 7